MPKTIAEITATKRVALTSPAVPPNSNAKTEDVCRQRGSATPKTIAEMDLMKAIFALKKRAPTTNSLALEPATAFLNLGCVMETMTASINRMNRTVLQ